MTDAQKQDFVRHRPRTPSGGRGADPDRRRRPAPREGDARWVATPGWSCGASPLFWISAALIVLFVLMAASRSCSPAPTRTTPTGQGAAATVSPRPGSATTTRAATSTPGPSTVRGPRSWSDLRHACSPWSSARSSASSPAYIGGWLDSVLGRVAEIFLGIPLLLGGILFLYVFPSDPLTTPFSVEVAKVALVLGVLGWPIIMRLMRSSVLQVSPTTTSRPRGRWARHPAGSSAPTSCPTRWPR